MESATFPSSPPKSAPSISTRPSKSGPRISGGHRIPTKRALRRVLLVLLGILIGGTAVFFLQKKARGNVAIAEELGTRAKPGPWGELYTVPFTIAAPDELIPVRSLESGGTHWVFRNSARSEVSQLLESAGVSSELRDRLLSPSVAQMKGVDLEMSPTPGMIMELPDKARFTVYRALAQFPANRSAFSFIHKDTVHDRFDNSGVSEDTLSLFHKFCCEHGDYLVLGGLPALLSQIPDYDEKIRFMKALTRQKTMLVRLRITPGSDVKELVKYWGKGRWAPKVRTLLDSIDRVPGSTFVGLTAMMPPLPASQLYFYPLAQNVAAPRSTQAHDCHWTSLNFFQDPSETMPVDPESFVAEVSGSYFPISGDPAFGDLLTLSKPDGEIVHSAIFIADEIVYTKNGATPIFPWTFSTVPDLLRQYSFHAPDGQQLTLRFFRNKNF